MIQKENAYPLKWPMGYKRTHIRMEARFSSADSKGRRIRTRMTDVYPQVENELRLLSAKNVVISTNIPVRKSDGGFYANYKQPDDPGVAIYFDLRGRALVLASDKWSRVEDNIRAIANTINRMRGIDRDGVSEFLERAFTGFDGLPEKAGLGDLNWYDLLGVNPLADEQTIRKAWKSKALKYHPNHPSGGNREQWDTYQRALEQGIARFKKS